VTSDRQYEHLPLHLPEHPKACDLIYFAALLTTGITERKMEHASWQEIHSKFVKGAAEHPDLLAHWDSRQDLWTLHALAGDVMTPAAPDSERLFKEAARIAVSLLGELHERQPCFHVWLDLMRKEKRGFRSIAQLSGWRGSESVEQFKDSGAVPSDAVFTESGMIAHVFNESAEFCKDFAARAHAGVPPHREDPVQENSFPHDHPAHKVWEKATRDAEQELLRFEQSILEAQPENYEQDEELHIRLFVRKFEIWAKRGLSVIANIADARAYEQWLESYVRSTLQLIEDKQPAGIQLTTFLPKLKKRLLRASKYWSANALQSVAAIETGDAQILTGQPELQRSAGSPGDKISHPLPENTGKPKYSRAAKGALNASDNPEMVPQAPRLNAEMITKWMSDEGYINDMLAIRLRVSVRTVSSMRNNGKYHGSDAITKLANLMKCDIEDLYLH
jgi:hypothetical protein